MLELMKRDNIDNISNIVGIINDPKEAMNIATNGFIKQKKLDSFTI